VPHKKPISEIVGPRVTTDHIRNIAAAVGATLEDKSTALSGSSYNKPIRICDLDDPSYDVPWTERDESWYINETSAASLIITDKY